MRISMSGSTLKFKVGDKVILLRDVSNVNSRNFWIGKELILKKGFHTADYGFGSSEIWTTNEMEMYIVRDNEIELSEVVESPLWDALRD
jgi:hypothetical protein